MKLFFVDFFESKLVYNELGQKLRHDNCFSLFYLRVAKNKHTKKACDFFYLKMKLINKVH